ncbi:MAG: O-methyltransferase [Floccifex porci]|uniref:O-methyltransferase n=1 Tax=Floccifex porci TaxID=2606629 RepID=A0A7X2N4H3_9FIRM|nr:O-methyltransferase [Floccifex porci]MSS02274.1 O-methyltransferase [Floccifex porci]
MSLQDEMKEYAMDHAVPVMMDEGQEFLISKIKEHKCKSFLEIGTAIAKTSIMVASLDKDMRVVTIERNPDMIEQAKINIDKADCSDRIHLIEGDALEVENPQGPFDCIFIDAAKAQYIRFFEKYCPLLSDNGIIITDNMEFHGLVKHPENTKNRNTRQLVLKIQKYHDYLEQLADYQTEFYSIGDGIALTRRKS